MGCAVVRHAEAFLAQGFPSSLLRGAGAPGCGGGRFRTELACLPSQCGTVDQGLYVNLTERNLQDAQKFLLMHDVVQPVSTAPSFLEDDSRFSHVVVDVVQGRDALVHIIYLATANDLLTFQFPNYWYGDLAFDIFSVTCG
ncbi:Semaphorin-5A [Tupaia chinensis]|uniref:Semaphorin-5A n=1 Tax=Tupaia chinensis TaxID=246437 RepID=L9L523_TUPCH|nr:Semaphorin-5A [Tupaia chinensis]